MARGRLGRNVRRHGSTLLLSAVAVALTLALVQYPDLAFQSAVRGLRVWWDIVFPALLPFFVAGQVLMALGVVDFLGVLMEPLMRPLFSVPGVGSFVCVMGLASGYPIGAVLTAKLRRAGKLTVAEAERLMSFTNTADPLFMAGAVAVGMFGNAALAGAIMAAHYTGALATGVCLKLHRRTDPPTPNPPSAGVDMGRRALSALVQARQNDGRAFGQVLGDAVRDSVNTLLLIGGFMIFFAVVIQLLARVGVVGLTTDLLARLLGPLGFTRGALRALVSGFFEITIGTQAAAQSGAPLLERLVVASGIIAWSGLSVLGQVAAVTQGTGVSLRPYVVSRILHACFAGAVTFALWNPAWQTGAATAIPAMAPIAAAPPPAISWLGTLEASALLLTALLGVAAVGCAVWLAPAALRGAAGGRR